MQVVVGRAGLIYLGGAACLMGAGINFVATPIGPTIIFGFLPSFLWQMIRSRIKTLACCPGSFLSPTPKFLSTCLSVRQSVSSNRETGHFLKPVTRSHAYLSLIPGFISLAERKKQIAYLKLHGY